MNAVSDAKGATIDATAAAPVAADTAWRVHATLWVLQTLVAFILFRDFLTGTQYFAYLDIAADTYEAFTGYAMHLARLFAREGFTGWSFGAGWGAPVAWMLGDGFRFLTMLGGPEHVLELRIWVYMLKIVLGGTFFLMLARTVVRHREAALLGALVYSFCGYMVVNGEWDSETQVFVFFPLILWAIGRYLRRRDVLSLPLAVGAALLCGVFFVTLAVSLGIAFLAFVVASEDWRAMARQWLLGVVPLVAVGFLFGAPMMVPLALQLLDSPRVSGDESLLHRVLAEALQVSDWRLVLEQLGAIFHKDLYGIGGLHSGYMNYLESPGFYVGLLPLLAASQLWRGTPSDRRLLRVAVAGVLLYMVFPAFRLAAFGFSSPYFRTTTMWVTLGILWLGLRGLDRMLDVGVDRRALLVGAAVLVLLLAAVAGLAPYVWVVHVYKIAILGALWVLALCVLAGPAARARLVPAMLLLAVLEIVLIAWPSYFALRSIAGPHTQPANDVTLPALEAIRRVERAPFYRVEKTYQSQSEADALLQDYNGVRSYYYHGRAVIDFHQSMGMMRRFGAFKPINFTNWTAAPGDRYFMHSLMGVRYVISKKAIDWPGFEQFAAGEGWFVYQNQLALPLGFVQSLQVTRGEIGQLAKLLPEPQQLFRDAALVNAVVLDELMPQWGGRYDIGAIAARGVVDVPTLYAIPAEALQRSGLVIESFRSDHIVGRIAPAQAGVLVFTIPAYRGWTLQVDGQPTPMFTANFGMLAAPVAAGSHRVELDYRMPGLVTGLAMFAAGVVALGWLSWRGRLK